MLRGKKTYIAAAGLVIFGITQLIAGDQAEGIRSILEALGIFGLRQAL